MTKSDKRKLQSIYKILKHACQNYVPFIDMCIKNMKTCMRIKNITFMRMVLSGKEGKGMESANLRKTMMIYEWKGHPWGLVMFALKSFAYV